MAIVQAVFLAVCLTLVSTASLPGSDPCTWGPSYWCKNVNQAEKCNTVDICVKQYWGIENGGKIIGTDKCTQGPAYWCSGADTISECDAAEYCAQANKNGGTTAPTNNFGGDKCTWGPSYWCSSVNSATECNMMEHCQKVWEAAQSDRTTTASKMEDLTGVVADGRDEPIGGDKCTWGPSYWCVDENSATKCGAMNYCQDVWEATAKPNL